MESITTEAEISMTVFREVNLTRDIKGISKLSLLQLIL